MNLEKRKEIFITKAKLIFPDYDYSLVEYVNNTTRVKIICPIHGEFFQRPNDLLFKHGCQQCGKVKSLLKTRLGTNVFIQRSKIVHGDTYDYSKTEYINQRTKVTITCKKHVDFLVLPQNHYNGSICGQCDLESRKGKFKLSTEELISRYKERWNDLYDYSLVEYNGDKKVKIICKHHGVFEQYWYDHMNCGCRQCANENNSFNKVVYYEKRPEKAEQMGWLYFITFRDKKSDKIFNKLGITNKINIEDRYSRGYDNYDMLNITKIRMSNIESALIEKFILKKYKRHKQPAPKDFKGRTECFDIFINLLGEIQEYWSLNENKNNNNE